MAISNQLHILIIPAWFQSACEGNTGIFVREQAVELAKAGHRVGLIYLSEYTAEEYNLNEDNYTEWIIPIKRFVNKWTKYFYLCKEYYTLYRRYTDKCGTPDLIHSHGLYSLIPATYIRLRKGINIIHTEHLGLLISSSKWSKLNLIAIIFYSFPHIIIVPSRLLFDNIKHMSPKKMVFIPGIVHRDYFNIQHSKKNTSVVNMLCVSDLEEKKGQSLLLSALKKILSKDYPVFLHLVGDGPNKELLEKYILDNHLGSRVRMHGKKTREEILELMPLIDLYTTATVSENFGTHIAEALAAGIFTITYDCKGPEFILKPNNSIIFYDYNENSFASAIISAIDLLDTHNTKMISDSVRNLIHPDIVIPQIIREYHEILGNEYQ